MIKTKAAIAIVFHHQALSTPPPPVALPKAEAATQQPPCSNRNKSPTAHNMIRAKTERFLGVATKRQIKVMPKNAP